ncbi:MAG: M23 family metallopeptidase [Clostridiaceae bacterium]|nr:M23 family metallopeptidase [Clostridiaceae bacterium]
MSNSRGSRSAAYYKKRRSKNGMNITAVKSMVFILVICFSLAMRFATSGPLYTAREKIASTLSRSLDFGDAIETLGRAFSGKNESDESAILVFGKMILGIDGNEEKASDETSRDYSPSQTTSISNTMAGDISGLTFDISDCPLPEMEIDVLIDGFTEDEGYDGTPNEAFEIPSPDNVDDNVYQIGFKTTHPVKGYTVTSKFGYRIHPISGNTTFHYGVDLAASAGTKVVSIADGTVTETGYGSINGNYIKISHKDGFVTHYAHLKSITVSKGERVSIGEKIGTVGSTGASTGPHLHFEVRRNGLVLDPFDYFAF